MPRENCHVSFGRLCEQLIGLCTSDLEGGGWEGHVWSGGAEGSLRCTYTLSAFLMLASALMEPDRRCCMFFMRMELYAASTSAMRASSFSILANRYCHPPPPVHRTDTSGLLQQLTSVLVRPRDDSCALAVGGASHRPCA